MKRILIVLLFVTILFSVDAAFAAPKAPRVEPIVDLKPIFDQLKELVIEILKNNMPFFLGIAAVSFALWEIEDFMKTRAEMAKRKVEFSNLVRKQVMKEEAKAEAKRIREEAFAKGWVHDGMGGYKPRDGVRIQSKNDDLRLEENRYSDTNSNNIIRATFFEESDDKSSERTGLDKHSDMFNVTNAEHNKLCVRNPFYGTKFAPGSSKMEAYVFFGVPLKRRCEPFPTLQTRRSRGIRASTANRSSARSPGPAIRPKLFGLVSLDASKKSEMITIWIRVREVK